MMQYAEIKQKLYDLYMFKNKTFTELSKESEVAYHTVRFIINGDQEMNCTQKTLVKLDKYLNTLKI